MKRIFLVGCARSGTTMLQHQISRNMPLYSPQETSFFYSLVGGSRYRKYSPEVSFSAALANLAASMFFTAGISPSVRKKRTFVELSAATQSECRAPKSNSIAESVACFNGHMDGLATGAGMTAWVEKTPNHIYYIDEITKLVPDAQFIHLTRKGEDVVASIVAAAPKFAGKHDFITDPLATAQRWNNAVDASLKYRHHPNHLLVSFETFIENPETELERIAGFTGLTKTPQPHIADIVAPGEIWKNHATDKISAPTEKFDALFSNEEKKQIRAMLSTPDFRQS